MTGVADACWLIPWDLAKLYRFVASGKMHLNKLIKH